MPRQAPFNCRIEVTDDQILHIICDLKHPCEPSNSGRSLIVASSAGNFNLYDKNGVRPEIFNITLWKPIPPDYMLEGK
jgi:hypothetical protein